jgi:tetratricopeptide (TPR) repeat protein
MRSSSALRLIFCLIVISVLLSACSHDPNARKQKHFQSGQHYFEKGKYEEAAIEFLNATKIDPDYADAHYQLAQSCLKMQQWSRAHQEFARTVELQPDNYQAHIYMADLLIAGHSFQEAQEQTDFLLQKRPNDPQVHVTVSNLLAGQGNFSGAVQEMQKATALDPGRWESYLNLALLQIRNNQLDEAETNIKRAVELNPKATDAQLLLGTYYQSRNRFSEAEQHFRNAIAIDLRNPDSRAVLARLYLIEGKKADAEEFLKQVKHDFSDNALGYRMLGDFYFTTGDLEKATVEYRTLYREHPKDIQVEKNYVQLLILKDRFDEARELDDEILSSDPNDNEALVCRSQIQIHDGHAKDAADTLQAVIKNDPENGLAHYRLGVAFEKWGDLDRAESEWKNALRLRPDLVEALEALARLAMRKGDMSALEQTTTQIIGLRPTSAEGYALRSISDINRKQFAHAEQDISKAIEVGPKSPLGYVQMGNLKFVQKRYSDARKAYQQALDLEPNSKDAVGGLINTYLAQKEIDQAVTVANAQIVKSPNNSGLYDLLGTVLANNKKDLDGAERALEKSAELDKNNSDAWLKLGRVRAAKGLVDEAIATFQQSLKVNPREANFYILMGELYESKQDWNKAKYAYQNALDLKPQDPLASNNLAYVLLQSGGNLDVAFSLAQTARRNLPGSPSTADTLGWVYYHKGLYKAAIDMFQEALILGEKKNVPDNPNIRYHLGLAYGKTNQPALARQQLERVLKINPNYHDAADVKKQLAALKS